MKVILYITNSLKKLQSDALYRVFYDVLKYLVITLIITSGLTIASIWVEFLNFLNHPVETRLFLLIIIGLVIIILTILLVNIRFRKQYKGLQIDNHTDELTGLRNHKALKTDLSSAISDAKESPLSLILLDVDNFKKFNSKTSHAVADQVLKKLGELLGNDKRVTDQTYRYFLRGDEFIVVTRETNLHQAFQAAERKRGIIESHTFEVDGGFHNLTVSCGVTQYIDGDNYDSFTDRVSRALNIAKEEKGKNCTKSIN